MSVAPRGKRSVDGRHPKAAPIVEKEAGESTGEALASSPGATTEGMESISTFQPSPNRQDDHAPRSALGTTIEADSLIFDPEWYKREYPDVAAASLDPVRHYFDNGVREGRNPNRYFQTLWYARNNPDVAAARLNPFMHYLLYGAREGRRPRPLSAAGEN